MINVLLFALTVFALGTLVVPDQGEGLILSAAIGKTSATQWTLRLFANDYTPVHGSTEANFTEASGGGYAAIPLTAASWTVTPGSPTTAVYPLQTFTFTGALTTNPTLYGYYITQADGKLVYAERLGAAFTPFNNGDIQTVTPRVTAASVASD